MATFGTRRVAVQNAKILFAELGAHPQARVVVLCCCCCMAGISSLLWWWC